MSLGLIFRYLMEEHCICGLYIQILFAANEKPSKITAAWAESRQNSMMVLHWQ